VIYSRRMRWASNVAYIGDVRNIYIYIEREREFLSEILKGRDDLENRGVEGRIILK